MKIEVNGTNSNNTIPAVYPKIKINPFTRKIVLFTSEGCGVCLRSIPRALGPGCFSVRWQGEYRSDFLEDRFVPFYGSITLTED